MPFELFEILKILCYLFPDKIYLLIIYSLYLLSFFVCKRVKDKVPVAVELYISSAEIWIDDATGYIL